MFEGQTSAADVLPPQKKQLERFFLVQKWSFGGVGIDPTSLNCTIYSHALLWIPLIGMISVVVPSFLFAKNYSADLNEACRILTPILQCVLATLKLFMFLWQRKKIVYLVRQVWFWNLEANTEELAILAEENLLNQRISLCYYCSAMVSSLMAVLIPVVVAAFFAWKGHNFWESLDPPFKGVYLMDIHETYFGYIFALAWDVLAMYCVVNASIGIDSLYGWFMRNIVGHFRILILRLQHLAQSDWGVANASEEHFRKSFSECIQYHLRVLKLVESFDNVYKYIVFLKFLISSLQIAIIIFQFPTTKEIAFLVMNVSFITSVAIQLMLYCHAGQRIKDMSGDVTFTIYEAFQWPDFSTKLIKLLLFPMIRSQKKCCFTGVFFEVDLNLFVWVFRLAGSFMTMMLSLYENND